MSTIPYLKQAYTLGLILKQQLSASLGYYVVNSVRASWNVKPRNIKHVIKDSFVYDLSKALLAILSDNCKKQAQFNAVVPLQKEMDRVGGFESTTIASLHSEAAHYCVPYPKSRFVEREWKITVQIPPFPLFFATFVAQYLQCKVLTKS
jgi:hypothetical protein